ncbi:MAG: DUF4159 domain-containing protein, partial [Tepidisphaerales bacterium]
MTRTRQFGFICVLLAILGAGAALRAAAPRRPGGRTRPRPAPVESDVAPAKVDQAIEKAIAYLKSQQKNGNWEVAAKGDFAGSGYPSVRGWQFGGLTSVALCGLLYAGESPQEAHVKQGIEWLKGQEVWGTYALGFRCQVWAMAPNHPGIRQVAQRDKDVLMAGLRREKRGGFYSYATDPKTRKPIPDRHGNQEIWADHSVSQYGVLGMWALTQVGAEVTDEYWKFTENAWRTEQHGSGGWSYLAEGPDTVAMTAAGLATLFIAQEQAHQFEGLECKGNVVDPHIEAALKWMHQNFANFEQHRPFYALYGVERVGVASGYKYFGNLDWFEVGARYLLARQNADGSWGREDGNENAKNVPDTAFGLMFLCRGRAPVMMNKLDYVCHGPDGKALPPTWNQRPRDVANIARWTGTQMERHLNWQVVNMSGKLEDWHDAPVLWMSGRDEIQFNKEEVAKLRSFVEQGGLILGNADCSRKAFAESFRKLGQEMFPLYEFRELPPGHVVYTGQQFKRDHWPAAPFMQGLSNGVRELMVLANSDFGLGFQVRSFASPRTEPIAQATANLFLYAVDKRNLRNKGESYLIERRRDVKVEQTIKLARLKYGGNCDPEPGGWRRLGNYMVNQHGADLAVESVELGDGKLTQGGYAAAHLTGTAKFHLSETQQAELKQYVDGGGTLVVDAAGGAPDFGLSAEAMLKQVFPGAGDLPMLAASHPVFAGDEKITSFEYRPYAMKQLGNTKTPRLRGFE